MHYGKSAPARIEDYNWHAVSVMEKDGDVAGNCRNSVDFFELSGIFGKNNPLRMHLSRHP
jgi:hypothetical protein